MGLLDKIRNLISRSKSKALPISTSFSKTDIDKTMPFITLDAITSLIGNQEVFDRFMHFDQNRQYFEGLTPVIRDDAPQEAKESFENYLKQLKEENK